MTGTFFSWNKSLPAIGALLLFASYFAGQENDAKSQISAAAEQEALKVLNNSDFAHTVTPTLQHQPCTYEHPAFPGLFPADRGALIEEMGPLAKDNRPVKADEAEYLIWFQSAKPVQFALQQLLTLGSKWLAYGAEKWSMPMNVEPGFADYSEFVTIAVILKHPGPDGTSLFDYAYRDDGRVFASLPFPCAGLRTSDGQVFARTLRPWANQDNTHKVVQLFFPRLINGKLLISGAHQKVEFRMVAKQRVFEATFFVNGDDVLDGSERVLYLPNAFTELNEVAHE